MASFKLKSMWLPKADAGMFKIVSTLVVGILFVVIGMSFINSTLHDESWVETQGKIEQFRETNSGDKATYRVTTVFLVEDKEYKNFDDISSKKAPVIGEAKDIAYNPNNPSENTLVVADVQLWAAYAIPIVGAYLVLVGTASGVMKAID